jgi:hypothetical protein
MAKVGPPQKLTPEQVDTLRRRYSAWYWNRPKRLMADFGISASTLTMYAKDKHKRGRE